MDVFEEFKNELAEAGLTQEDLHKTSEDMLGKLGEEIENKFKLEEEIAKLEAQKKEKEEQLTKLDRETIPQLVEAAGLSEVTTKNKCKVTIRKEYRGAISEANSAAALAWFIKSGGADTIKNEYTIPISINDSESARTFEAILNKVGLDFKRKLGIPWNTLAGVIKELDVSGKLEDNNEFEQVKKELHLADDMTLKKILGAYSYNTTKVKRPKNT